MTEIWNCFELTYRLEKHNFLCEGKHEALDLSLYAAAAVWDYKGIMFLERNQGKETRGKRVQSIEWYFN